MCSLSLFLSLSTSPVICGNEISKTKILRTTKSSPPVDFTFNSDWDLMFRIPLILSYSHSKLPNIISVGRLPNKLLFIFSLNFQPWIILYYTQVMWWWIRQNQLYSCYTCAISGYTIMWCYCFLIFVASNNSYLKNVSYFVLVISTWNCVWCRFAVSFCDNTWALWNKLIV